MFWLILIASSTWFGFEIFPFIITDSFDLSFRIMNGWLIGSLISGFFIFFLNFFCSVNWLSSLLVIIFQSFISFYLRKKRQQYIKNDFNEILQPWCLFFMIFISGLSLRFLSQVYSKFPFSIPYIFKSVFDDELSFISYTRNFRRSNLFFYKEPRLSGFYYRGYSIPLLYTSSLMSLGASYSDASIIICLFNTISLSFIVMKNSMTYAKWFLVPCFLFFFSSPSAFRLFFNDKSRVNIQNDLVHQIEPGHFTISYQTFFYMMSASKMSSYTIALTQYAIYHRSGFLSLLIPNVPAQIGTFFTLFVEKKTNFPKIFPIIFLIFSRIFPFNFSYFPLFREEAMKGVLFAAFKIWFDSFSIMIFSLFFQKRMADVFRNELFSRLAGFCLVIFIREGNDRFINYSAAVALIGPTINLLFSLSMKILINSVKSEEIQGAFIYVHYAIFFTFCIGGFICGNRILNAREDFMGINETKLINWINKNVPKESVLFIKPRLLHPAILAKRSLFLGDKRALYLYGYKITKSFLAYKEIVQSNFSAAALEKFNIHYVIDDISDSFANNASLFENRVIYSNERYRLFKF